MLKLTSPPLLAAGIAAAASVLVLLYSLYTSPESDDTENHQSTESTSDGDENITLLRPDLDQQKKNLNKHEIADSKSSSEVERSQPEFEVDDVSESTVILNDILNICHDAENVCCGRSIAVQTLSNWDTRDGHNISKTIYKNDRTPKGRRTGELSHVFVRETASLPKDFKCSSKASNANVYGDIETQAKGAFLTSKDMLRRLVRNKRRRRKRHTTEVTILPVQCVHHRNINTTGDFFIHQNVTRKRRWYQKRRSLDSASRDLKTFEIADSDDDSVSDSESHDSFQKAKQFDDGKSDSVELMGIVEHRIECKYYNCFRVTILSRVVVTESNISAVLSDMEHSHPVLRMRKATDEVHGLHGSDIDFEYVSNNASYTSYDPSNPKGYYIWKVRAIKPDIEGVELNKSTMDILFLLDKDIFHPENCQRLFQEFVMRLNQNVSSDCVLSRRRLILPFDMITKGSV